MLSILLLGGQPDDPWVVVSLAIINMLQIVLLAWIAARQHRQNSKKKK